MPAMTLVLVLCLGAEPTAPALTVDAFLDAWAEKTRDVHSLTLSFRQEKRLRLLRRPKLSEGEVFYAGEKLFVRVREPGGSVETELLLRDGTLKILYLKLKRLEVIEVGKSGRTGGGGPGPLPVFTADPRTLKKDFEVAVERRGAEDVLRLRPQKEGSEVKEIEIVLADFQLRRYRQVSTTGDELRLEVTSVTPNPDLPADTFELKVPPGTKTVRPAP